MRWIAISVLFVVVLLFPARVFADVKINEFLIDPDQKVELFNTGNGSVDISGWYIDDSGGSQYFTIPGGTSISAHSCLVFSGDFNLNKSSSDTVRLFDSSKNPTDSGASPVDSHDYPSSPGSNVSYQRVPNGTGDFQSKSESLEKNNDTEAPCVGGAGSPPPTSSAVNNIYISEALVAPSSGQNEWIELYNDNDATVSLDNWYVDDVSSGGSAPKQFSLTIPAKSYAVYEVGTSMFNNDGDNVRLLDSSQTEKDSFSYSDSDNDMTVGPTLFGAHDSCLRNATRGSVNSGCIAPTSSQTSSKTPTPTKKPSTTPIPSKKSTTTKKSSSSRSFSSSSTGSSPSQLGTNGAAPSVLGTKDKKIAKGENSLKKTAQGLSIASFFGSLTSAGLIIIKMKKLA